MKRLEFLIRQLRQSANIDGNDYSDELLERYFDEAQSKIRNIIFLSNNNSNILKRIYELDVVTGQREYPLPERMYAENSILTVKYLSNSTDRDRWIPLRKLNIKSFETEFGYTLYNKELWLSAWPERSGFNQLQVIYNSQLPNLRLRSGSIQTISGNDVTLAAGFDGDLINKGDYLTFVEFDGSIVKSDIRILAQVGPTITVDDATGLGVGDYCLSGAYSTTNSELPVVCEEFLMKYVERRCAIGDSSAVDTNSTDLLTQEEKQEIMSLFEKSSDDVDYPIISPETPWL